MSHPTRTSRRTAHRLKWERSGKIPSLGSAPRSSSFPTRTPSARGRRTNRACRSAGRRRTPPPGIVERFTVLDGEFTSNGAETQAFFARERPPLSTRMYGTTGGMRPTETLACAWK